MRSSACSPSSHLLRTPLLGVHPQHPTTDQRLLFAARTDNLDLLNEVLAGPAGSFDVNFQDGLGMTALHYAAGSCAVNVLPELLEQEVDVDLHNRLEGNTPLHEAIKIENEEARSWVGESSIAGRC